MLKEKLSYLGETLNGRDISDNLKRIALNAAGFIASWKALVEISRPSGNVPDEFIPFVSVPIVFLLEMTRQMAFPLYDKIEKGEWTRSVLNNISKLAKVIRSR